MVEPVEHNRKKKKRGREGEKKTDRSWTPQNDTRSLLSSEDPLNKPKEREGERGKEGPVDGLCLRSRPLRSLLSAQGEEKKKEEEEKEGNQGRARVPRSATISCRRVAPTGKRGKKREKREARTQKQGQYSTPLATSTQRVLILEGGKRRGGGKGMGGIRATNFLGLAQLCFSLSQPRKISHLKPEGEKKKKNGGGGKRGGEGDRRARTHDERDLSPLRVSI